MGEEGESGVTASCWGCEEAPSIAPFHLPELRTNGEIKQEESSRETKIALVLLRKLVLNNVACISGQCASSYCTLASGNPFCLAEREGTLFLQASTREKREQLLVPNSGPRGGGFGEDSGFVRTLYVTQ